MLAMFNNLRLSFRQLKKSPGFVATAIITLALGIGANAVVFSVLNALLLRPLNVPQAQNLYLLQRSQYPNQSYLDYLDLRDRNQTFQSLAAYQIMGPAGVDSGGNPSTAWPFLASGNFFDTLGVQPYLGRFFHASDEKGLNSAPYVVLSYALWHSYFHGDLGVVGKTVAVNRHPFTIIGVAPSAFRGTELFFSPAMWIPLVEEPMVTGQNPMLHRGNHNPLVIGRVKPGVSPADATADLNAVAAWMAKTYPADDDGLKFTLARPGLMGDMLRERARAFMAGLMLLTGLILLAACANLGSLFAARAADRSKEVALRLALGSRRRTILRQLLTEALLISLAGGVAGLALGVVVLRGLSAWQPIPDVPINIPVNPDFRTYAVALLLALGSGLLFGMVPVRQVMRADPWQIIRTGISGAMGTRRFTLRDVLLVVQIAICAVLVTSSLVAVRGLARSLHGDYGFQPRNAMVVNTDLHMAGYDDDRGQQMEQRILDAVAAIPGVSGVGYASQLPLNAGGGGDADVFADSATDYRPTNAITYAMNYSVSPGYMAAAGTRLLAGRDLTRNDNSNAPAVALVNRQFAVKVFGSVDKAVGSHFKLSNGSRTQVVGVVEDGKYRSLTEERHTAMFFSFMQHKSSSTWLTVRSGRDPAELAGDLERTLHGLDSGLPFTVRTWTQEMDGALFAARVATIALGVLGLLGAMLAVTGIFGMASYVVSKRLRELGIRMALGAGQQQVLRASLGRVLRLLAIGSGAGVILGVLGTRVLSLIVYEATPKDPLVLIGVTVAILLLGMVGAWIPARRALSVDPLILLRYE